MFSADSTDAVGGRFALLHSEAERPVGNSTKSSKRRRRKSAKGHHDDDQSDLQQPTVAVNGTNNGTASLGKPPLRSISEVAVLRSNSADASSRLEAVTEHNLQLTEPQQQSTADLLHHALRKPHLSLSFQESRPANEGNCCLPSEP